MQRILHPVGQGAFYTEQFIDDSVSNLNSEIVNVVYDCGSESNNFYLTREIKKTFSEDDLIDILFVSHFHNDHINGFHELVKLNITVKTLVLPLLNNSQKILAYLNSGVSNFNILSLFPTLQVQKIIYILPITIQDNEIPISLEEEAVDVNTDTSSSLKSGGKLKLNGLVDWIYIPFNICNPSTYDIFYNELVTSNKSLAEKLKVIVEGKPFDEISEIEGLTSEDWKQLKKVYDTAFPAKLNEYSMVVYSGPANSWKSTVIGRLPKTITKANACPLVGFPSWRSTREPGALYTGDIDLNKKIQITSYGIPMSVLDYLARKFKYYLDNIGLFQIPHHGSKYNFTPQLFHSFPNVPSFFYSYGLKNRHNHPYSKIRLRCMGRGKNLFEITENAKSEVAQIIIIKWKMIKYSNYET